eukprot:1985858-Karenia_brevis.AAC.1
MILGDLNADPNDIPSLQFSLDGGQMYDLGAHAAIFGTPACQATCFPHNSAVATRRDYISQAAASYHYHACYYYH